MQKFVITDLEAGQRFDKYLHKLLSGAGTGFLYKMLRKKNIVLNGKKSEGKEILRAGDEVSVFMSDETIATFRGLNGKNEGAKTADYEKAYEALGKIPILFENEHVLIVNKPAGILSQKAADTDSSLNEWLIGYLLHTGQITDKELLTFKPSVCNRLDRNTSGLLLCGKTLLGSREMSRILKERSVHKYYRTFVKGHIDKGMQIQDYLQKDEKTNKVRIIKDKENALKAGADYIETAYQPLREFEDYTYLEVLLITGKTHQIRAHLASIGHPILGDFKYGDEAFNKKYHCKAQLLHAYRLEFQALPEELADLSKKIIVAPEPEKFLKLH